jgi:hypothetical protein
LPTRRKRGGRASLHARKGGGGPARRASIPRAQKGLGRRLGRRLGLGWWYSSGDAASARSCQSQQSSHRCCCRRRRRRTAERLSSRGSRIPRRSIIRTGIARRACRARPCLPIVADSCRRRIRIDRTGQLHNASPAQPPWLVSTRPNAYCREESRLGMNKEHGSGADRHGAPRADAGLPSARRRTQATGTSPGRVRRRPNGFMLPRLLRYCSGEMRPPTFK